MTTHCTANDGPPVTETDPASWVDAHGDYLFRYALHRVHDIAVAEELVQETFLAALEAIASFDARSALRTWLTAILRHKIADHFRARAREDGPDLHRLADWIEELFDRRGVWRKKHGRWPALPSGAPERAEFAAQIEECLTQLPSAVAELFVLYEQRGVPADRLAQEIGVTTNTLWVRLYRARVSLRECLQRHWFEERRR
ncbi:MAG: sigma-70 family RNA polymerase sigma factor [Planctomycetes bacterium]|nr:sigma-70 family RNA polymerase sigma factor [Planctomycetota bacterium]